jgi:two-component system cell cycle response regulator
MGGDTAQRQPQTDPTEAGAEACLRILLIDGDPDGRDYLERCLCGRSGLERMELHHARTAAEARSCLSRSNYALIIVGVDPAGEEGLKPFFLARNAAPNSAVMVMTAVEDQDLADHAARAGAQDYLVKSEFSPGLVRRSILAALERHAALKEAAENVRELRRKVSRLHDLANADPVTGLLNRRGLARWLAQPAPGHGGAAGGTAVIVQLENFKAARDLFGTRWGDRTLEEVGARIRPMLRAGEACARLGDDQLLFWGHPVAGPAAMDLVERFRGAVGAAGSAVAGASVKLTARIGLVKAPPLPSRLDALIDLARGALKPSADPQAGGWLEKGAAPRRLPFFNIGSRQMAGHLCFPEGDLEAFSTGSQARDQALALIRAACAADGGLECHAQLSHIGLMQLRPEDLPSPVRLSGGARLRLSIPAVPMSPLPPGFLQSVRRLQSAGWAFVLSGLTLGADALANLVQLEPAAVTLAPALLAGIAADEQRLRGLVRLRKTLAALNAHVVAGGVASVEELNVLEALGIEQAWGPYFA